MIEFFYSMLKYDKILMNGLVILGECTRIVLSIVIKINDYT